MSGWFCLKVVKSSLVDLNYHHAKPTHKIFAFKEIIEDGDVNCFGTSCNCSCFLPSTIRKIPVLPFR